MGQALADFIAFSSPEAIVLFGGLAKSGDYIMKPIQKAIDENILKIYAGKTKLLLSQLKDADAAVLGASALGWEVKRKTNVFIRIKKIGPRQFVGADFLFLFFDGYFAGLFKGFFPFLCVREPCF